MWKPEKVYKFLSMSKDPLWVGKPSYSTLNMTLDGTNFHQETRQTLYGSYFFVSNERVEHSRKVYSIVDLLAALGGLLSLLLAVFKGIGHFFNKEQIVAKFIRSLYFTKEPKSVKISWMGLKYQAFSD